MDIFSLMDAGYPIRDMIKEAVIGFANCRPIKLYLDDPFLFDANEQSKCSHLCFTIPEKETNAINMLKSLKKRSVSNFCKSIFRSCMIQQNIACYFAANTFTKEQISTIMSFNLGMDIKSIPNVRYLSSYPKKEVQRKIEALEPTQKNQTAALEHTISTTIERPPEPVNPFASIDIEKHVSKARERADEFKRNTLAESLQPKPQKNPVQAMQAQTFEASTSFNPPDAEPSLKTRLTEELKQPIEDMGNLTSSDIQQSIEPIEKTPVTMKQNLQLDIAEAESDDDEFINTSETVSIGLVQDMGMLDMFGDD